MAFRILWVDDNIEELRSHVVYLGEKGYAVEGVTNGIDALAIDEAARVDEMLWEETLAPQMLDSGGETIIASAAEWRPKRPASGAVSSIRRTMPNRNRPASTCAAWSELVTTVSFVRSRSNRASARTRGSAIDCWRSLSSLRIISRAG